ncbi:uncharacterized protein BJ212DRAFT_1300416 [Suillus subaureus]|uniref:CCHC-type domain-containing protein n=1 Tax=Suillus subaureus TaxID=48587 RepID=A0A9P7JCI4_9AGAM|nr:uncharacterized protein BJ212DRAFT_1300416 [Suillus subaureus]KAG1814599.1 hypothetical protein BJ212DRAFT_1300416 [Suillus subaureus]
MPATSMSTLASTHPIHEALPIKQEFETLHMPNSIPGSTIVGNLPCKYEPQSSSKLTPITTANQQLIMATLYKMPIHGTNKALKFNGTTENLVDFIDIYKGHTDEVGLLGLNHIKGIICYLPPSERELQGGVTIILTLACRCGLPEARLSNYKAFIKEVKESQVMSRCRSTCLIKYPDHHPWEPHPYMHVFKARQFLLLATATSPVTQTSALITDLMSLVAMPMSTQQLVQGSVMKCEYQYRDGNMPPRDDCIFCGSLEHFLSQCPEKLRYIKAGKCKLSNTTQRLVLLSSDYIPSREGLLKEHIDQYHANHTVKEVLPNSSITMGLFYCVLPDIEVVLDIGSSAFVHTTESKSEMDEDNREVMCAT